MKHFLENQIKIFLWTVNNHDKNIIFHKILNIKYNFQPLIFVHQMILKSLVGCYYHLSPGDPKRHEEPEERENHTDLPRLSTTTKI